MKIAIRGHESRGKEVIQILESLGGINKWNQNGRCPTSAYYIDGVGNIYCFEICGYHGDKKIYTLEEFEKEFPFKIGDKITNGGEEYLIIDMDLSACELNYKVRTSLGSVSWVRTCDLTAHQYKQVEEMKEVRNITLTLEKAKEWYKKGGELKEIALQAFTEKELNPLPRSWEEFCTRHNTIKDDEHYIDVDSNLLRVNDMISNHNRLEIADRNICPSKKSAEAHLALIQLEQLRNCWRQGWVQTPTNAGYRINKLLTGDYTVMSVGSCKYFLAFPTKEMAEEFLKCFRDLIEKAGDLI